MRGEPADSDNGIRALVTWIQRNYWRKSDCTDTTTGAANKFRPVTLNVNGYLDDTLWYPGRGQVKMSVSSGDTLTIASGYEYLVSGLFTVSGTVIATGNLVVL
jgi:hypothetical protein